MHIPTVVFHPLHQLLRLLGLEAGADTRPPFRSTYALFMEEGVHLGVVLGVLRKW